MSTQTFEQAGRLTHNHSPTYEYTLALLGNRTTQTKTGTRHIFIRSLTLTSTHTHVQAKQTRTGIIGYETTTRAVND